MRTCFIGVLALAAACGLAASFASAQAPAATQPAPAPYSVVAKWEVGGGERWDYITLDAAARRLYIGHGNVVSVVDADTGKLVGDVADTQGVHGVAIAGGKGFATCGKDGTVAVFDLKTLQITSRVKAGQKPDAIVYDPASDRVLACNGNSGDITVIDPAKAEATATLAVGGKLEFAATDGKGHVYVNVEDKSELVSIDSKAMKVEAHWPLAPGTEPTGLAMDIPNRRLFAGCSNETLVIVNADNGKIIDTVKTGPGVDGVTFDAGSTTAFVAAGGNGTMTVVPPVAIIAIPNYAPKFTGVTIETIKSARTLVADEKTHQVYLPCMLPGEGGKKTFGVLVLAPAKADAAAPGGGR